MTCVPAEAESSKKAPTDGWGIEYVEEAIVVGIYITDTRDFKEPELPDLVVKDVASAANVSTARTPSRDVARTRSLCAVVAGLEFVRECTMHAAR